MKMKINLDTMTNIQDFVNKVSSVKEEVYLKDGNNFCVSAKSLLGSLAAVEWKEIYCECEKDISTLIMPWII